MTFWYGIQPTEIHRMPMAMIEAYLERLPQVQAESKIVLVDPLMVPHMKAGEARRAFRRWETAAGARGTNTPREALPALLSFMGIGVQHVPR